METQQIVYSFFVSNLQAQKDIQKLSVENAKLQYRVTHLVKALKEADCKLDSEG